MPNTKTLLVTAEKALRGVGIEAGQTCLDFGCGHGNYTIPLAGIVGPTGTVHALDKDTAELDRLDDRARDAGLGNVVRTVSSGDLRTVLRDASVDVILLYDVLHSYYFSSEQRDMLFGEIGRIARANALLSIFPNHMGRDEIQQEIVRRAAAIGFKDVREHTGPVVHDDGVIKGRIITFTRGKANT